jgi:hypothetical protein
MTSFNATPIALDVNEFNQALGLSDLGLAATACLRDRPIGGATQSNFVTLHFDVDQPLKRLTSPLLKRIAAHADTRHVAIGIQDGDRSEVVAITTSEFDPEVEAWHFEQLPDLARSCGSKLWPMRVAAAVAKVRSAPTV